MGVFDIAVIGASFAGVACATEAASRGLKVLLLERKADPGKGLNTTGILVEEAAELLKPPAHLVKTITDIRLYGPSLRAIELRADRYFFLSTDTPALLRHAVGEAGRAGACVQLDTPFIRGCEGVDGLISINGGAYHARMLIGADGPRSRVAQAFGLGVNQRFLVGAEAELTHLDLDNPQAFYCFLDAEHAHGYLGWAIPGVGVTQVGLASTGRVKPDLRGFMRRIGPVIGMAGAEQVAQRGGLIPVGGLVTPSFAEKVVLIGDAAGTVSPLTAGGIHNAIYYGRRLGALCADYLKADGPHPGPALMREYPRFGFKLGLRNLYERAPNWALDALFVMPGFEMAARQIFFLKKRLPGRRPVRVKPHKTPGRSSTEAGVPVRRK